MCQEKIAPAMASVERATTQNAASHEATIEETPAPLYPRSRRVRLLKGLPRKRLFQMIHYHHRNGEVSSRALGFYLLDLERRREFQTPGSVSAVQYAQGALGMQAREARALLRVATALEDLPELDGAFDRGEIAWSKLREITHVAVPETELEWLSFAKEHNCREVEAAVSRKRRGQKPPDPSDLGTPRVTFRIQYDISAALNATWQKALEKLMAEAGKSSTPLDALKAMAEMALATDPDRRIPPGLSTIPPGLSTIPPGRHERPEPVYTVVYHIGPDGRAWHEGEDGREAIPIEAALAVKESAHVIEVPDLDGTDLSGASAILFGERGSVPPEARDRPTPEWMRSAVLAREGHRCAICGSREDCRVHHVESRADGGKTQITPRATWFARPGAARRRRRRGPGWRGDRIPSDQEGTRVLPLRHRRARLSRPWATIGLMVLNAVVFGLLVSGNFDAGGYVLWYDEGLHPTQWITSNFVHGGLIHLLGNLAFLWVFGLVVEGKPPDLKWRRGRGSRRKRSGSGTPESSRSTDVRMETASPLR